MFSVFLKGHLLTKKFFTFLIGSTFMTTKIKTSNYQKPVKIDNSKQMVKDKSQIYVHKVSIPDYILSNFKFNKDSEHNPIKSFKFLIGNIFLSVRNIFYLLVVFNRKSIAFCDIPKPKKPYLGCSIRANEEGQKGMKIVMIKSDSPAEKAGLKVKDIILEIEGKSILSINDYNAAIGFEAGTKKMKVLRIEEGKEKLLEFEVNFIYSE